ASQQGQETLDELLRNADLALCAAKARGEGSQEIFDGRMHVAMLERMDLETELRRAVDHDQFFLHYQPTVDIQTGAILGSEALVRWRHPRRGIIPPDVFIPIAEETGLVVPIGRWVLREACEKTRAWQIAHGRELLVNVNLSPRQLRDDAIVADVK